MLTHHVPQTLCIPALPPFLRCSLVTLPPPFKKAVRNCSEVKHRFFGHAILAAEWSEVLCHVSTRCGCFAPRFSTCLSIRVVLFESWGFSLTLLIPRTHKHLTYRALAAIASNPMELVKVRLQSHGNPHKGVAAVVRHVTVSHGLRGLWKGTVPSAVCPRPYSTLWVAVEGDSALRGVFLCLCTTLLCRIDSEVNYVSGWRFQSIRHDPILPFPSRFFIEIRSHRIFTVALWNEDRCICGS